MLRNVLIAIAVGLAALILVDGARRAKNQPGPPVVQPSAAVPDGQVARRIRQGVQAITPGNDPGQLIPPTTTPALDLMAKLATRRRLAREGNNVYLDSLFPHTDSALTRWADRTTLHVMLVPDTLLKRWTPDLLDEARAAMRAWDGAGSGLVLRESGPTDSVDITVHWADMLSDSGQVGSTTLRWSSDGVAHSGAITLALRRNTDSAIVPPATRARVAIHEFGHALGLPHSDSRDDIMFRNSPVAAPSLRDQATLRLLYALFPGSLRVQP